MNDNIDLKRLIDDLKNLMNVNNQLRPQPGQKGIHQTTGGHHSGWSPLRTFNHFRSDDMTKVSQTMSKPVPP